jgi:hypothetical protein
MHEENQPTTHQSEHEELPKNKPRSGGRQSVMDGTSLSIYLSIYLFRLEIPR